MAILKKNADGTLPAAPTTETFFTKITDAVRVPFMAADEYLDASGAFWASLTWGSLGVVGGSVLTRKRVNEGKPAVLGVIL